MSQSVEEIENSLSLPGPKPMGGLGGGAPPPADHLSENFALLSEFLCSKSLVLEDFEEK